MAKPLSHRALRDLVFRKPSPAIKIKKKRSRDHRGRYAKGGSVQQMADGGTPNPFDEFDSQPVSSASAPVANPFDEFDAKSEPESSGIASYIPKAISDIPHEAYEATANQVRNIGQAYSNISQRHAEQAKKDASSSGSFFDPSALVGSLKDVGDTGKALVSAASIPVAPVQGAAESLIGHPMAAAEHIVGSIINPEAAAKDDPMKMYEQAKSDVDTAMSAARPAGAPIKAPNLWGTRGYEWAAPPSPAPVAAAPPVAPAAGSDVVSAAQRASEASGVPINVPRAFASDSAALQRAGQLARNVPFVGDSIPRATGEMVDQMGQAVGSIASNYGEGSGPNIASRIGNRISGAADVERTGAENAARASDEALMADWQRSQDQALHQVGQNETAALAQARDATGDMSPQDMGQELIARLRQGEQEARARKDALYQTAGESDAAIHAGAVRDVHDLVSDTLHNAGRVVDAQLTPAANAMMNELHNFSNLQIPNRVGPHPPNPADVASVSAQGLEQTRKRLGNMGQAATNDADRAAARIIMNRYDEWEAHAYDNALYSGSPEALQVARQARAANRNWRQTFYNDRDDADRLINRVVTGEVTPQEMSNWIVGSGQVGAKGTASRLITRLGEATGNDPGAMNTIRSGVANRLFGTTEGATARAPERIAGDIHEFFNGSGRDVANRLFDPQQRQAALNYATALRRGQEARADIAGVARATRPTSMPDGTGPMQDLATAVLGKSGKTDEALFSAIDSYARSGGRGDIQTLSDIVRNIPQKDKGDLAGSIIRKLGYSDQTKGFSPEKFATEWNKYTPQAKTVLFGNAGPHRQALDDIAQIAQRYKEVGRRFGNPSGTAQNAIGFGTVAALWTHPLTAIPALLGGTVFAHMLSAPATAQKTAGLMKSSLAMLQSPTAGNMARLTYAANNFAKAAQGYGSNISAPQFVNQLVQGPGTANASQNPSFNDRFPKGNSFPTRLRVTPMPRPSNSDQKKKKSVGIRNQ